MIILFRGWSSIFFIFIKQAAVLIVVLKTATCYFLDSVNQEIWSDEQGFYRHTRGRKVLKNVWRVLDCARPRDVTLWNAGTCQWRITFLKAWFNLKMPPFRPISWYLASLFFMFVDWKSSRFNLFFFHLPISTLKAFLDCTENLYWRF